MKMFADKNLSQSIDFVSFGEVEIGDSKEITVYLQNDSSHKLKNLEFTASEKEVKIIDAPAEMLKETVVPLTLRWSPSLTLKKGINTEIKIKGLEIYT